MAKMQLKRGNELVKSGHDLIHHRKELVSIESCQQSDGYFNTFTIAAVPRDGCLIVGTKAGFCRGRWL